MKYVAVLKQDNDIILRGDICCTNLSELYKALTDKNTTDILISKEFANEYFTYAALCDFISYSASLVPHVRIEVEDTLYEGDVKAIKNLKSFRKSDELIYALESNPTKVLSTIQYLCNYFLESHDESSMANNRVANMAVRLSELESKLSYSESERHKLTEVKNDIESKLHALVSRVNFRYEKTVNPDKMFIATENGYNHVLYIKEISRVHYTDTLIYYLSEILKTLYDVPVRTVVIEPYYSYGRERLYPRMKPHWDLTYRDVYSGDIFMAGYQPKVMEDILRNPNHVNYLIVLDRAGYQYPHIDCTNTTYVYTASDLVDVPEDVDFRKVISYDAGTLYIPYIEDFNKLSPESKVQKYSTMNVTKELIKYLEEVSK